MIRSLEYLQEHTLPITYRAARRQAAIQGHCKIRRNWRGQWERKRAPSRSRVFTCLLASVGFPRLLRCALQRSESLRLGRRPSNLVTLLRFFTVFLFILLINLPNDEIPHTNALQMQSHVSSPIGRSRAAPCSVHDAPTATYDVPYTTDVWRYLTFFRSFAPLLDPF